MLNLKTTHKAVKDYYKSLAKLNDAGAIHETAVKTAFSALLQYCCKRVDWNLVEEYKIDKDVSHIRVDGILKNHEDIEMGHWEAKDENDDLDEEIRKKFAAGYPKDNIIFQSPNRAVVYQNAVKVLDEDISDAKKLVQTLNLFFNFRTDIQLDWEQAVEQFKEKIPQYGAKLVEIIDEQKISNRAFIEAYEEFARMCRKSVNPNLSDAAIEEMLIQHILTERIFRRVFNNPDFVNRNAVAKKIDKVVDALTSSSFSKYEFLKPLERFYKALERRAETIYDYPRKQAFLNAVYENFFQGFAVKVADTHGIVYTPQEIVEFMVLSVDEILKREFGKSLGERNVHIIDPFVGTGNFILRVMRAIPRMKLEYKYKNELHCNEVMLLPYYIASMNIEREFYDSMNRYEPFEGICLVDSFDLASVAQMEIGVTEENTQRVAKQLDTKLFAVIGNPPYNAGQVNENDNNKNRKYKNIDMQVANTYARHSKATNKNMLSDPYVKAFRWATDKIRDNGEGIVAFVSNNSFIDGIAMDGMRKELAKDFDKIYHFNLRGNARTSGELRRKEKGNVFDDKIRVSVGISFLIRKKEREQFKVFYREIDDYLTSKQKKQELVNAKNIYETEWRVLTPNKDCTWLTEGLDEDFENYLPMDGKYKSDGIFENFSRGAETTRDSWAYNFNKGELKKNMSNTIDFYNQLIWKAQHKKDDEAVEDYFDYDDSKISWSSRLKETFMRFQEAEFLEQNIRNSIYRPFSFRYLYFDPIFTHRRGQFPKIFPTPETEEENLVICVTAVGNTKPFHCITVKCIPDLHLCGDTQCFPFYSYDEEGGGRHENVSDWALARFREAYADDGISKRDIFNYIYGVLHHRDYAERYSANLRRELPRIPFLRDFRAFAAAGERLAELHANYEDVEPYELEPIENPNKRYTLRVKKMKLSKDKQTIIYNDYLKLTGVPLKAYEYKLGNRSALEWVIDQYQVKTDKRSGIINDPNRPDDERYIADLIGKVIAVSLETVSVVESLPEFEVLK